MSNMKYTVELALKNFLEKNQLKEEDVKVITELEDNQGVIIRVPNGNVQMLREAETTIYHGQRFDVFTFQCLTGKSGRLQYDDVLTDEYRYKCM